MESEAGGLAGKDKGLDFGGKNRIRSILGADTCMLLLARSCHCVAKKIFYRSGLPIDED